MKKHRSDKSPFIPEEIIEEFQRVVLGIGIALGPVVVRKIQEIPHEQLGELFKLSMARAIEVPAIPYIVEVPTSAPVETGATFEEVRAELNLTLDDYLNAQRGLIVRNRQRLVRSGQLISAAELRIGLGLSKSAFEKAESAGKIFSVDVDSLSYYPQFYLSDRIDFTALGRATKILVNLAGWSKWQFFTTESIFLGGVTPLEALVRGRVADVQACARGFLER